MFRPTSYLTLVLLFSSVSITVGQSNVSPIDIIQASIEKSNSDRYQELENYDYRLPLIDNAQFRTETNDFLLNQQDYRLRVRPNSPRAQKATKKYYAARLEEQKLLSREKRGQIIDFHYHYLLDYIYQQRIAAAMKHKIRLLEDKRRVVENEVYDKNFDITDLVEAKDEVFNANSLRSKLSEQINNRERYLAQILEDTGAEVQIDTVGLITPEFIINYNPELAESTEQINILLKQNKIEALALESEMDIADTKNLLRYVEVEYQTRQDFIFNDVFSIGLGINLPFFGNARLQRGDYLLEKAEEETELEILKQEATQSEINARAQFNAAKETYTALQEEIENNSYDALIREMSSNASMNTKNLVKLYIFKLNREVKLIEAERALMHAFLRVVSFRNDMTAEPLRNYLNISAYLDD
ncbi:MAG: hypothetical protein WBG46_12225 [Nonlabens sp.]